jgi:2-amino-4-hydroxy-6-hydroxymethyldihydropteridine diphosphokinase
VSRAVLSLGSNLGDRQGHLAKAVTALRPYLIRVSSVYQTPPWGPVPQDDYYNLAALVQSPLIDAEGWLALAGELEEAAGRVRETRWGPRTLDVDVIVVDDVVSADPHLTLPHPRAHQRAFVLLPWYEIEPTAVLPGHGPIAGLLADLGGHDLSVVGNVG